jgi:hypothetical protein
MILKLRSFFSLKSYFKTSDPIYSDPIYSDPIYSDPLKIEKKSKKLRTIIQNQFNFRPAKDSSLFN